MNQSTILSRLNQIEVFASMLAKEATMLKRELSGVVSDNSPKRGKRLPDSELAKIKAKGEKRRLRIHKK